MEIAQEERGTVTNFVRADKGIDMSAAASPAINLADAVVNLDALRDADRAGSAVSVVHL